MIEVTAGRSTEGESLWLLTSPGDFVRYPSNMHLASREYRKG